MNEQSIVKDRFSPNIEITYKDFESSGWEKAFQGNGMNVSSCVSEILSKTGKKQRKMAKPPKVKFSGFWRMYAL